MEDAGCPWIQAMGEVSYFEETCILAMEIQSDNSEDERAAS